LKIGNHITVVKISYFDGFMNFNCDSRGSHSLKKLSIVIFYYFVDFK